MTRRRFGSKGLEVGETVGAAVEVAAGMRILLSLAFCLSKQNLRRGHCTLNAEVLLLILVEGAPSSLAMLSSMQTLFGSLLSFLLTHAFFFASHGCPFLGAPRRTMGGNSRPS